MNSIIKNLAVITLTIAEITSLYAQDCLPPQSLIPVDMKGCRIIGRARVFENEKKELTSGGIKRYLVGKQSYIKPAPNARIRVSGNVLIMNLSWHAPKSMIPESAHLGFLLYSNTLLKYKYKSKLIIFVDGKQLVSETLEQGTSIEIAERFFLRMKYLDFLKFTGAKRITIQLGKLKIALKPKDIEALNDLNKTTKQLKLPPSPVNYM